MPADRRPNGLRLGLEKIRDRGEVNFAVHGTYGGEKVWTITSLPPAMALPCYDWLRLQQQAEERPPLDIATVRQSPEHCEGLIKTCAHPRTDIL